MSWMAWNWYTAAFFIAIAALLTIMTLLAIYRPETPRVGILQFPTTRGDRLFVSLIGSAFIYIVWIRLTGGTTMWPPLVLVLLYWTAMFRYA